MPGVGPSFTSDTGRFGSSHHDGPSLIMMLLDIFALTSRICLSLKPKVMSTRKRLWMSEVVSSFPERFPRDQIFLLNTLSSHGECSILIRFKGLEGNAGEAETWHQYLFDSERYGTLGKKLGYFHECLGKLAPTPSNSNQRFGL